ncbi:MAG: nucleotidyltransferase family protein [Gemmatimonadetes bacterium]|nr:nucleotidyltransferase family protein [Gemmatimonadota bacterium]
MTVADQRIARWKSTLDPKHLWPESSNDERLACYREILEVTRLILQGEKAALTVRNAGMVRAFGVAAFMSGMGPLLGWWIERQQLAASDPLAATLAEHLAHGRKRADQMTGRLARVVRALAERGIVPTVLKGTYTARRYFPEPGSRPVADIDLLVSDAEFQAAGEVLRSLGLQSLATHALPQREEWGPTQDPPVHSVDLAHADSPWAVDLHRSLDRTYFRGLVAGFGTPDPAWLERWDSGAGWVTVPTQPLLAAHLAVHAAADFPNMSLIRLVELILVLRADLTSGRLAWAAVSRLLKETGNLRFAYPALALAGSLAPGAIDPSVLEECAADATPRMRRAVPRVRDFPPQHFTHRSLEMRLVWANGPRQIVLNLLDWIYPVGPQISTRARLRILRRRFGLLLSGRVVLRSIPKHDRGR